MWRRCRAPLRSGASSRGRDPSRSRSRRHPRISRQDHPPLANWPSLGFFPKEGRFEEKVPVILVVIMVVAWIIILGPSLLRRRARGGGVNSTSHFHRQLRVLEHSAPEPIVAPAYRLRAVAGSAGVGDGSAAGGPDVAPVLTVVG